jgi:hypothetical protein
MKRRDFIAGLGGAAASLPSLPLAVRAEQPALPVIGLLISTPLETYSDDLDAFRRGLAETGHVEGQNVAFEYRTAENHFDRLPALADDLVRRRVAAIFTVVNVNPALAAKAASRVTPIVFFMGAARAIARRVSRRTLGGPPHRDYDELRRVAGFHPHQHGVLAGLLEGGEFLANVIGLRHNLAAESGRSQTGSNQGGSTVSGAGRWRPG